MEPKLQPKTGRLALQAAVDSGSSGRSRSSREQAPAYYTSMRQSANQRKTVEALHWNQGSSRSQAAGQPTHWHEAPRRRKGFQVRCKRQPMAQETSSRGPAGPRHQWAATCRQQPVNTTQLALGWRRDWTGQGIHIYQHAPAAAAPCNATASHGPTVHRAGCASRTQQVEAGTCRPCGA